MPVKLKAEVLSPRIRPTTLLVNRFGNNARPGSLLLEVRQETAAIAEEMAQEARDAIYTARFRLAPLDPNYRLWKKERGLDTRILIATRKYVRAIGFVETPYGYRIGVRRGFRIDEGRRLEYWRLQRWHEYGTKYMKARPVWRKLMRSWKDRRAQYGARLKGRIGVELAQLVRQGY